jgi:hypothetical protein
MVRNEGGLPTKCQAQKKNKKSKQRKRMGRMGRKMTCSGSARAHCKASGCICLNKKRNKKRGRNGGRKGVFIDEGMGCLRPLETDRSGDCRVRGCARHAERRVYIWCLPGRKGSRPFTCDSSSFQVSISAFGGLQPNLIRDVWTNEIRYTGITRKQFDELVILGRL